MPAGTPPPPPGGFGQGLPPGYAPPPVTRTNGFAITSLATGLLALPFWFCCCATYGGGPFGIAAIATGVIALKRIRRSQGAERGEGLAIAGIILGALGLAMALLAVFTSFDEMIRQRYGPNVPGPQ
jgi:hypothetical protein